MHPHRRRWLTCLLLLCSSSAYAFHGAIIPPTLPREGIPPETPSEIRILIEQLYSPQAEEREEALTTLGDLGASAAPAVPYLVDMLRGGNQLLLPVSVAAMTGPVDGSTSRALSRIGPLAIPALLQALPGKDEVRSAYAAAALAGIDDPRALEAVFALLGDGRPLVRMTAAERLAMRGTRALPRLQQALTEPDPRLRAGAVEALGAVDDPQAMPLLLRAARDSSPAVRRAVLTAVGPQTGPVPAELLRAALTDPDASVRSTALWMRGRLLELPADWRPMLRGSVPEVRQATLALVGTTGDRRLVPEVIRLLSDPERDTRLRAIEALKRLGGPEAIAALRGCLADPDAPCAREALTCLADLRDSGSVPLILQYLRGRKDEYELCLAVKALERLRAREAVPTLRGLLREGSTGTRLQAASALAAIGDGSCLPELLQMLSSRLPACREEAASALATLEAYEVSADLRELLTTGPAEQRRELYQGLARCPHPADFARLVAGLHDADADVRVRAAGGLRRLAAPQSLGELIAAATDGSAAVRREAILALSALAEPAAAPTIREALRDSEEWVREAAACALNREPDPQATELLLRAAALPAGEVPPAVIAALGRTGAPRAAGPLLELLAASPNNDRVGEAAAWALGQLHPPEAYEPLLRAALRSTASRTRPQAIAALAAYSCPETAAALVGLLQQPPTAGYAAAALARTDCPAVTVPALLACLEASGPYVELSTSARRQLYPDVARALASSGDLRAIPALRRLLRSIHVDTRVAAVLALGRLSRQALPAREERPPSDSPLERCAYRLADGEQLGGPDLAQLRALRHDPEGQVLRAQARDLTLVPELLDTRLGDYDLGFRSRRQFDLLRQVTGEPFGDSWAVWQHWWDRRQGPSTAAPESPDQNDGRAPGLEARQLHAPAVPTGDWLQGRLSLLSE